jgi:type II secretory pathway pseudopilin PulG
MSARPRHAFTLFELILSIALSAVLLGLIGTAINLYLVRVEKSRERVEEAQLARSILAMIADDLRSTAIYQPQDVSAVSQLVANSASFDVDSIDDERSGDTSSPATPGATSGLGGSSTAGTAGGVGMSGGTGTPGSGAATGSETTADSEMPLGLSGTIGEMYVDIERLPGGDELFRTLTGYTNAKMPVTDGNAMAATGTAWGSTPQPTDLKTIRYFIREGDRSETSGMAATSLLPELQINTGGLVRQEIPRPARIYAEQNGASAVLESGQKLIAPEVIQIEFRYFDGEQVTDRWDMAEEQRLPLAIDVSVWLVTAEEAARLGNSMYNVQELLNSARLYRQTVFLPMSELTRSGAATSGSTSASSSSGSSTGSSTTGSSTSSSQSGSGSTFGFGSSQQ